MEDSQIIKEYRILWIDDSPAWVDSIKSEIEDHIKEHEFAHNIEVLEDGEAIESKIHEADISLVIVDHQLDTKNGDVLIKEFRERGHFTEIVYYSQNGLPDNTNLAGVFAVLRDDASEEIKRVIDLTVHKFKDLGVFRGLLIAQCIDLEVKIEKLILKWFSDKAPVVERRLMNQMFFDFKKKLDMLTSILKETISNSEGEHQQKLRVAKQALSTFEDDVIHKRNALAHVRPVISEDGMIHLSGKTAAATFDFTDDLVHELRIKLRNHSKNLEALDDLIVTG